MMYEKNQSFIHRIAHLVITTDYLRICRRIV